MFPSNQLNGNACRTYLSQLNVPSSHCVHGGRAPVLSIAGVVGRVKRGIVVEVVGAFAKDVPLLAGHFSKMTKNSNKHDKTRTKIENVGFLRE